MFSEAISRFQLTLFAGNTEIMNISTHLGRKVLFLLNVPEIVLSLFVVLFFGSEFVSIKRFISFATFCSLQ